MVCDVLRSRIDRVVDFDTPACGTPLVVPETIFIISLKERVSFLYVITFMSGSAPDNIMSYFISRFTHLQQFLRARATYAQTAEPCQRPVVKNGGQVLTAFAHCSALELRKSPRRKRVVLPPNYS